MFSAFVRLTRYLRLDFNQQKIIECGVSACLIVKFSLAISMTSMDLQFHRLSPEKF
jgi:hypothetical protein